ncbi:MAG TPA: ATP-dependent helicase, partial [Flavobacteriaceae bacterium]|nr:ATP-dependent helicase [Flavobacteriaceae bacterium]
MALTTLEEIFKCIDTRESFILDAGAGSGKTWSLVESIKYVIDKQGKEFSRNNQKIVCITYTNVAKDEIIARIENNELVMVSTIHDFLWSCVSQFKTELKEKLIEIIDEKIIKINEKLKSTRNTTTQTYQKNLEKKEKLESDKVELQFTNKTMKYKNYFSYRNNIVSHDEVIELSQRLFSSYSVIKKLIVDTYPIVFVDEYQDTFPSVIKILLDDLNADNLLLGFYGDKMQKIYDKGIGEIPSTYNLKAITKLENYRCSVSVVGLLNKIRDDIQQIPSGNNKEVQGSYSFSQASEDNFNLSEFIDSNLKDRFGIEDDRSNLKILYLTHKLIARENEYEELYSLVNGVGKSDALTKKDEDRCPFIKFLYEVEDIVDLFQGNKIQRLLKKYSFEMNSFEEKKQLKRILNILVKIRKRKKITYVMRYVIKYRLLQKSNKMNDFNLEDESNSEYYNSLMQIEYNQIIKACKTADEKTPFSTKHGTKGAEFENVLVVIDDSAWAMYSFDKYFAGD